MLKTNDNQKIIGFWISQTNFNIKEIHPYSDINYSQFLITFIQQKLLKYIQSKELILQISTNQLLRNHD